MRGRIEELIRRRREQLHALGEHADGLSDEQVLEGALAECLRPREFPAVGSPICLDVRRYGGEHMYYQGLVLTGVADTGHLRVSVGDPRFDERPVTPLPDAYAWTAINLGPNPYADAIHPSAEAVDRAHAALANLYAQLSRSAATP